MGTTLAWALLLGPLLLLQRLWGQGLSCSVLSGDLDGSLKSNNRCLNLSGHALPRPADWPPAARNLRLLDLSATGLRELSLPLLAPLQQLRVLSVLHNPLDSVDVALAVRCELELRADCGCALGPWHQARQDNCSSREPLRCLHPATGTWHNLSTFLHSSCAPGLGPGAAAGLAAGSLLLSGLLVAGGVLAWRRYGGCVASTQAPGKAWGPQGAARPGSGVQPRYSSRSPSLQAPPAALPGPAAPDYENIFVGQLDHRREWLDHRAHPFEESDFYMNYRSPSLDMQPVYGNLQGPGEEATYEISQH